MGTHLPKEGIFTTFQGGAGGWDFKRAYTFTIVVGQDLYFDIIWISGEYSAHFVAGSIFVLSGKSEA